MTSGILFAFGDSLVAGYGAEYASAPDPGRAPFGNPSTRVKVYGRWLSSDSAVKLVQAAYVGPTWIALSADSSNWDKTGATPLYSLSEAFARFYGLDEVFVILFGVPGSDASPLHPNPAGSWHPSIGAGLLAKYISGYVQPALASAEVKAGAEVSGIFVSLGQNCGASSFPLGASQALNTDIEAVITSMVASSKLSHHPSVVLLSNPMLPRAAPAGFSPIQVWHSIEQQQAWVRTPSSFGKALADIDGVELQADTIHPTQLGQIEVGLRGFFGLISAGPSQVTPYDN